MFVKVLKKVFKSKQERDIKKLQPIIDKIKGLESDVKKLSDDELRAKTGEFKGRLESGETLDDILPEAFAVVREVAQRTLGQRHYDVQLMGGITLHNGSIAEMKTGEGKTLAATLSVYLNALLGRGVHVATVNDYLAKRDAEWMGSIYRFLGMSVGVTLNRHDLEDPTWDKQVAYQSDITYGIASEFGFDYLRDNMARSKDELVQRELYYTIVDEVDSVLIDEARTPLIISGERMDDEIPEDMYKRANAAILPLKEGVHYTIDRKESKRGRVMLTEEGIRSVEKSLGIKNLYGMSDVFEESAHYLKINGAIVLTEAGIKELEFADESLSGKSEGAPILKENLHYIIANKAVVLSLEGLSEIEGSLSGSTNFEINTDYTIQNDVVLLTEEGLKKISENFKLTKLKPNVHYIKVKENIILTETGIKAIEKALKDRETTLLESSPEIEDREPAEGNGEPILLEDFHYLIASGTAMLTEEGVAEIAKNAGALSENVHYVAVTRRIGKRKMFLLTEEGFEIIKRAYKDISFDLDDEEGEKREAFYAIANQETARKLLTLTREGIRAINELIKSKKLYDDSNLQEDKDAILRKNLAHYVDQALTAHTLYERDVDYVVQDGEVILIDEQTGRLQYGRRLSDGLHQAIEAKERAKLGRRGGTGGVKIVKEMHTIARISYQNYFRMYDKLSGMTGTAETEATEFMDIYKLDVVVIPTNEPMIRIDHPDVIYKTKDAKYRAIVNEIIEYHKAGRPILVGTPHSPEKPAEISKRLRQKRIPHQVLTAKEHAKEASIIAQAGVPGTVTVATNMAGRGVDILLGGNPEILAREKLRKSGGEKITLDSDEWKKALQKAEKTCAEGKKKVLEQGGLHIIGTERHDSRRIDNQLRGRAGRQGDPGSSRFYLSLEDELMLSFGGGRMASLMSRAMEEDIPLEHNLVSKSIEKAQRRMEQHLFEWRKNQLKLDDVMNMQRGIIYEQRRMVLDGEDLKDEIFSMFEDVLEGELDKYVEDGGWIVEGLVLWLSNYGIKIALTEPQRLSYDEMRQKILDAFSETYEEREKEIGFDNMRLVEQQILLRTVDRHWENYLYDIDYLEDGIWLRGAEGRDPIITFKTEAHEIFSEMTYRIKRDVTNLILHASIDTQRRASRKRLVQMRGRTKVKLPGELNVKVGRNDPCPCGSGKKYKRCCGW